MAVTRPYHHGNLRQAVLDRAVVMLRERGAAELSLRELAREIGVTHAAPRRYFADRQALLDALAVDGFARLGARLRDAAATGQARAVAAAYLGFATADANLVELMFAHKHGADADSVAQSAADAFAPLLELFGEERTSLRFLATLQGLAGLANCGVIAAERLDELIDDAVVGLPLREADRTERR